MHLLSAIDAGETVRLYEVEGQDAWPLAPQAMDVRAAIDRWQDGSRLERTGPPVPRSRLQPALPIAAPGKIVCLGLNYVEHAREGGHEIPTYPALFLRACTSVIPAEAPMILPRASVTLDYEAELMVVIGRRGRHIDEAEALSHVFGYTIFNDGSVREYQRKTQQWTAGKNFDGTGAIGPVVVTADELPAGAAGLRISTRLNGQTVQDSNTADMIFPVARTIAILSEIMTLEPGDLIALGTPAGVGHARRPQLWMKDGDVVEVEIEGIGICRNRIVTESACAAARDAA